MHLWQRILLKNTAPAVAATAATNKLWTWGSGTVGQLGLSGIFSIAQVTSGGSHQAALTSDGRIFTWGYNNLGQLGDGTSINKSSPTQIGGQQSWLAVSAGSAFTLAVRNDGGLFAWGDNTQGQLGLNVSSLFRAYSPVQIGTSSWTAVSAGDSHAMAIRSDGKLYAWGLNANGQLGDGTTDIKSSPTQIGSSSWTVVSAGGFHSLAILTGGALFAWGLNTAGQLGTTNIAAAGDTVDRSSPVQLGTSAWTAISAGNNHTLAIKSGGTLWAWGNNANGQLGNITTISRSSPVQLGALATWSKIAAGISFSLGTLTTGQVYAWGRNEFGQLGIGLTGTANNRSSPTQIGTSSWTAVAASRSSGTATGATLAAGLWGWGINTVGQVGDNTTTDRNAPVALTYTAIIRTYAPWQVDASSWTLVKVGGSHTVAVKSVNTLWTWGLNNAGQLAQSNTINRSSPTQIGTSSWVAISGSKTGSYTVAISAIRTLYTWGHNASGQLGDATTINKSAVTLIAFGASSWSQVSAGLNTTAAITLIGTLFIWGNNNVGQLGDTTTVNKSSPTLVGGSWSKVSVGGSHVLAIRSDNTLWSWGFNSTGQLGQGDTFNRSAPAQIGTSSWQQVSAGTDHSLAIAGDGSLWAWGQGTSGQLGVLTESQSWAQIAEGDSFTLAKRSDGTIWSWGLNNTGQLGIGNVVNRSSPTQIGLSSWSQVFVGYNTGFAGAIKGDGTLWTWGLNTSGQLGDGTFITKSSPVQVAQVTADNSWINAAAGADYVLGITKGGSLWGWGSSTGLNIQPGPFSWTQISESAAHTLAIRNDGLMFAWGLNNAGQLGLNDTLNRSSPVQVGYQSWSLVSAGASHTLAVAIDGTLWSWGLNSSSQLGTADLLSRSNPTQISSLSWIQISAANTHSTGISDKILYTWGLGTSGQLGELTDALSWTSISASTSGLSGIAEGQLFTWGFNTAGVLGLGNDTFNRSSPVQLGVKLGISSWTQVSSSVDSMIAIDSDKLAYVWGNNNAGQLGLGDTINRSSPVQLGVLPVDVSAFSRFRSITKFGNPTISTSMTPFPNTYSGGFNLSNPGVASPTVRDYIFVNTDFYVTSLTTKIQIPGGGFIPYNSTAAPGQYPAYANGSLADFTMEAWIYATSFTGPTNSISILSYGLDYAQLRINPGGANPSTLGFYSTTTAGGNGSQVNGGAIYLNRWHHVAATRQSGIFYTYVDGARVGADAANTAMLLNTSSTFFTIGASLSGAAGYFIGYISNARVTNGTAVYTTASFQPPRKPLTGAQIANANGIPSAAIDARNVGFLAYATSYTIGAGVSFTQVAAGGSFMMGIDSQSRLWSWGKNDVGQLGLGANDTFNRSIPVQIGMSSWTQIRANASTAFAIRADSGLFTWGLGTNGILASGATANRPSPVQVGTSSWTQVAIGPNSTHALGIKLDGTLWSWGLNSSMQLGDNTTVNKSSPVLVGVTNGGSWTAIAVGDAHSLGIKIDGTLWAWGNNAVYQLGLFNSTLSRSSPTQIGTSSWSAVAAGVSSTIAKDITGKVYVWGLNSSGQLGLTDTINRSSPTILGNTLPPYYGAPNKVGTSSWAAVSAGDSYTVAITLDRKLWAWGLNSSYQLGDNTSVTKSTPVQIATSISNWTSVSADNTHTGAITALGELYMWGINANGQLGSGDTITRSSPTIIPGSTSWKAIAAGVGHTVAIDNSNTIWTWGLDNAGQLGQGSTTGNSSNPVQVSSDHVWTKITAGTSFSAAIDNTGNMYTWGLNTTGQIGDHTTNNKSSPTQIGSGILSFNTNDPIKITPGSWSQVTAGNSISAAIKTDGSAWSWGLDDVGQLGLDAYFTYFTDPIYSPTQIGGSRSWSQISAGADHMVGLTTDKALYIWGGSSGGKLGLDQDYNDTGTPTLLPNEYATTSWSSVAAGISYTVASTVDGRLYTWGLNSVGQLGQGHTFNRSYPIQVDSTGFSQTLFDRSTYNTAAQVWTKVGEAHLASTNPFQYTEYSDTNLYGGSLYLPVEYSYLEGPVPANTGLYQFDLIGDFTVEGWVHLTNYATGFGGTVVPILTIDDGVTNPGFFSLGVSSNDNQLAVDVPYVGAQYYGSTLQLHRWYHIAMSRKDGVISVYLDGTLDTAVSGSNPFTYANDIILAGTGASATLKIGKMPSQDAYFRGFIHAVRVSRKAVYTGNFAKPTVPLGTSQPASTNISSLSPGEVVFLGCCDLTIGTGNFGQVAAGPTTGAALTTPAGKAVMWGTGASGQLGEVVRAINRSNMTQVGVVYPLSAVTTPQPVNQTSNWTEVSAGNSYSMAIRGDGKLFGWGINTNGVLGTGDNLSRSKPTQIGTNTWKTIDAGISHTAGITSGGTTSLS